MILAEDYGAVGDGIAIDHVAMQNAIAAAKGQKSYLGLRSGATYNIGNSSLFCGKQGDGYASLSGIVGNGATIIASGSPAILDWTGALHYSVRDLNVISDEATPSTVGILQSRLATSMTSGNIRTSGHGLFDNVWVTGAYTYATVFNLMSETNFWTKCFLENNHGQYVYAQSRSNPDSITSPNAQMIAPDTTTNTNNHFVMTNFHHTADTAPDKYAAVYLGSASGISFRNCLFHDNDDTGALVRIVRESTSLARITFQDSVFHPHYRYGIVLSVSSLKDLHVESCQFDSSSDADVYAENDGNNPGLYLDRPRINARRIDLDGVNSNIRDGGELHIADKHQTGVLKVNKAISCTVVARQSDNLELPTNHNAMIHYVE